MNIKSIEIVYGPERPRGAMSHCIVVKVTTLSGQAASAVGTFEDLSGWLTGYEEAVSTAKNLLAGFANDDRVSVKQVIEMSGEITGKVAVKLGKNDNEVADLVSMCGADEQAKVTESCLSIGIEPILVEGVSNKAVFYSIMALLKKIATPYPEDPDQK